MGREFTSTTIHEGVDVAVFGYRIVSEQGSDGRCEARMVWEEDPALGLRVAREGQSFRFDPANIPFSDRTRREEWA